MMMQRIMFILMVTAVLCLPAAAKHGKPGKPDKHGRGERVEVHGPYFRSADTVLISRHCRVKSLPPGLRKKLYRTGHLPPGWERNFAPLPVVVEQQLPPVCGGCRRGLIGNFAVVYDTRTSIIVDIAIIP